MPIKLAALLFFWIFSPGLPADTLQSEGVEFDYQNRIALQADPENVSMLTEERLTIAADAGVDLLSLSSTSALQQSSALNSFYVLLTSDDPYHAPTALTNKRAEIADGILTRYRTAYRDISGRIAAVELIRYSDDRHPGFADAAAAIADTVSGFIDRPFFYGSAYPSPDISPPPRFSFYSVNVSPDNLDAYRSSAYTRFIPSNDDRQTLLALQQILEAKSELDNSIIEIPAGWFFERLESQPELSRVFLAHTEGRYLSFPLPAETQDRPGINWSVFFLFLIWITLLVHLKFLPLYAQSLPRYFLNHTFFVADVMENRIRTSMSGFIILIQHAFITGLFFYVSAEILISPAGLDVLERHAPYLFFLNDPLLSLFFAGLLTALVLQVISVTWIYLLNRKMHFLSQALNLYSWPLHINFVVVTLLVVLNQTGTAELWMASLSILFAVIWFLSFNVAAIDGIRFLPANQVTYFFLTVGLHTVIIGLLIWLVFYTPSVYEPLKMALTFP